MTILTPWNSNHHALWVNSEPRVKISGGKLINFFLPKNPISLKRQLNFMPVKLEYHLGKLCNYTLFWRHPLSLKRISDRELTYQQLAEDILGKLVAQVPDCYGKPWNFRISVVKLAKSNAFATLGGNIYISEELIDDIYHFCSRQRVQEISLSTNGSNGEPVSVNVPIDQFSAEAALAFVIGHEMTHVCARHITRAQTIYRLVLGALLCLRIAVKYTSDRVQSKLTLFLDKPPITNVSLFLYALALLIASALLACLPTRLIRIFNETYDKKDAYLEVQSYFELIASSFFYLMIYKSFDLLSLRFDRMREFECDKWGMRFSAGAQYDPRAALLFQEIMEQSHMATPKRLNWFLNLNSTHPSEKSRKAKLIEEIRNRDQSLLD